jgi:8-oxo-dGTP pyrophosphatase MutT (NUDIX family)
MSFTEYYCENKCCSIKIIENSKDSEYLHKRRGNYYKSGCFIYDPDQNKVLLVQSRGYLWGMPKGSVNVDEGEEVFECAIRETKEETGITITSTDFLRAIKVKNRAVYYYVEKKAEDILPQINEDPEANDANGITWIKIDCLKELVKSGKIMLNDHCKIAFRKLLDITFPKNDFVQVK